MLRGYQPVAVARAFVAHTCTFMHVGLAGLIRSNNRGIEVASRARAAQATFSHDVRRTLSPVKRNVALSNHVTRRGRPFNSLLSRSRAQK